MAKQEISTLKNGLRVSADEMREVETVSIGVFVGTGSRNEELAINGISHFLEHMAFKGTKTRNAREIAEEFESIGGRINAYTSKERTVYYVKVLKKHAEFAVEFLADILQNSTFDEVELEKERGVILQEIAMTNDTPDDIVYDYFQEAAYPSQAVGRCILGPAKNIKKFKRQHFVDYVSKQYNYSNMAVVAAGNIKHKDLVKYAEKYFNNLGSKKIKKPEAAKYKGGVVIKNISFIKTKKRIKNKYWGKISDLFSSDNSCAKEIFMKKNTQSSMEFHINKHESYFILEGELDIGLRFGRAKQRITKLKKNNIFTMLPGTMHMRMAKKDTIIIEMSNKDDDKDSIIVHDGKKYKFKIN